MSSSAYQEFLAENMTENPPMVLQMPSFSEVVLAVMKLHAEIFSQFYPACEEDDWQTIYLRLKVNGSWELKHGEPWEDMKGYWGDSRFTRDADIDSFKLIADDLLQQIRYALAH